METCLGTNHNAPHCTVGREITRFIALGLCKPHNRVKLGLWTSEQDKLGVGFTRGLLLPVTERFFELCAPKPRNFKIYYLNQDHAVVVSRKGLSQSIPLAWIGLDSKFRQDKRYQREVLSQRRSWICRLTVPPVGKLQPWNLLCTLRSSYAVQCSTLRVSSSSSFRHTRT